MLVTEDSFDCVPHEPFNTFDVKYTGTVMTQYLDGLCRTIITWMTSL